MEAIVPAFGTDPSEAPIAAPAAVDAESSAVARRMIVAFLSTLAAGIVRIAPAAWRITYGPGETKRITLRSVAPENVSDRVPRHHVAAGLSNSKRREGYTRAALAQAAMLLLFGERKLANLVMEAHGAERPKDAKPESWAAALDACVSS